MSAIDLGLIKADLRVTHGDDDALLQAHLDASEDEALRFMDRVCLPSHTGCESCSDDPASSEAPVAPSVFAAICLLVRAKYDAASPADIATLRDCAEALLMPYRLGLGV